MTQSMASVSSLARDFSWEQLHTDTEREVMMIMVVTVLAMNDDDGGEMLNFDFEGDNDGGQHWQSG